MPSQIIRSVVVRPGAVFVRVGKHEIEIPRGDQFQEWLDRNTPQGADVLMALAVKQALAQGSTLQTLKADLEGKRVNVTVAIETP